MSPLSFFFFFENETEENGKREESGKNRKRHRSGDPFCEIPIRAVVMEFRAVLREFLNRMCTQRRHFDLERIALSCATCLCRVAQEPNKLGTPLTSTSPTSTFVLGPGVLLSGFELERSSVATSLEGFSVTSHEKKKHQGPLLKG